MFRCDDFVAICAVGLLTLLSPVDEATLSLNSFSSLVPLSSSVVAFDLPDCVAFFTAVESLQRAAQSHQPALRW